MKRGTSSPENYFSQKYKNFTDEKNFCAHKIGCPNRLFIRKNNYLC